MKAEQREIATKPIARIQKNKREELWLAIDRINVEGVEKDVINARLFANHKGVVRPTYYGWTLDVSAIPSLIAGFQAVEKEAIAKGLLGA